MGEDGLVGGEVLVILLAEGTAGVKVHIVLLWHISRYVLNLPACKAL